MMWECLQAQAKRRRTRSTGGRLLVGAKIRRIRPSLGCSKLPCWRSRREEATFILVQVDSWSSRHQMYYPFPTVGCQSPTHIVQFFCFATSRLLIPFLHLLSYNIIRLIIAVLHLLSHYVCSCYIYSISAFCKLIFPSLSHWLYSTFLLAILLYDHVVLQFLYRTGG